MQLAHWFKNCILFLTCVWFVGCLVLSAFNFYYRQVVITYEHVIHCSETDDDDDDDDDEQESISFQCLNGVCVCMRACV